MQYLLIMAAALAVAPLPAAAQTADAGQHQGHQTSQQSGQHDPHVGHDMTADCCAEKGEKAAKADCCKKEDGKTCCNPKQKAAPAPQSHQGH
ncbi:hypothetical protein ACMGDH_12005 [Sphingomonas sp. DT-207]|uniref:hypothetical protein n=1 Tax=Sphingomonas sp. DT-207 TaxID=3396167 RepID=UPI003F1B94B3